MGRQWLWSGRDGKHEHRPSATEFTILAAMPESQVEDRKAFLLHSFPVDLTLFKAVVAIH